MSQKREKFSGWVSKGSNIGLREVEGEVENTSLSSERCNYG